MWPFSWARCLKIPLLLPWLHAQCPFPALCLCPSFLTQCMFCLFICCQLLSAHSWKHRGAEHRLWRGGGSLSCAWYMTHCECSLHACWHTSLGNALFVDFCMDICSSLGGFKKQFHINNFICVFLINLYFKKGYYPSSAMTERASESSYELC